VRRSLALIAVVAAVAAAAAVVAIGVSWGDGSSAGAADGQATGPLPSGHPSMPAADDQPSADETTTDEAVAELEQKRAEDPGDLQVLLDLGDAYFMRQRLRQAEEAYSEALGRDPGNTAAEVGLAMIWHSQGDSERAEKTLDEVLEAHPDDQGAHYSLAIVYFSAGKVEAARQEWRTAARIDPTSVTGRRSQSFVDLLEDRESASPPTGGD
jgi:cytochrome c-type biogenesis protein CcmH/NrfG